MLFDMAIDLWLVLAPQWEQPAPTAAEGGAEADPAASPGPGDATGPDTEAAAVFKGYLVEPSYFWHCEDNAFSMAWHQVLPESVQEDRRDEASRQEADERLRHAARHLQPPGEAG